VVRQPIRWRQKLDFWQVLWGDSSIVRSHHEHNRHESPLIAIAIADDMAANNMKNVLFD